MRPQELDLSSKIAKPAQAIQRGIFQHLRARSAGSILLRAFTSILAMLPVAVDMELGSNSTSLIIRLSNELRDAQASLRRDVIVARALAATPPQSKDHHDG